MEQGTKAPVWPFWIYGSIIGGAGIIFYLTFYVFGFIAKSWITYAIILAMFGTLIGMLFMHRGEHLGGYAQYKQYIWISLLSSLLATFICAVFYLILITVFDDGILEAQKVEAMERIPKTIEKMEKLLGSMSDEQKEEAIDAALDQIENSKIIGNPWLSALMNFVGVLFMLVPLSFLAPVFARKKRSEAEPPINQTV